ncbi:MAG: glycosyltransferase family 2 protein [Candidatus Omnitrophica bacterium]|nr:glycosyltransferase family 2 protein [Candidatus Omnitrophota bacterium]
MKLSIIIPTYNEHNTIAQLIHYVQSVKYPIAHEIIIVDDASIDRTYEKETMIRLKNRHEDNNIRLFKNRINRGKGYSIRKGIRQAHGELIVIQDADTEYKPSEIPKLLDPILKGEADVVYGSRFLGCCYPKGMAWPNWMANRFLTFLTNLLFKLPLTDMETCYKVFRADIVKHLALKANRFSFEPEVTALLAKKGIRIMELPISYEGRTSKEGKKIKAKDFLFAVLTLFKYYFIKQLPEKK